MHYCSYPSGNHACALGISLQEASLLVNTCKGRVSLASMPLEQVEGGVCSASWH